LRESPEKKEEKERVRHALLRATLRLAATHGYASLGLREAAREAGIAPTSFYRHFQDMGALGLALVTDLVEPLVRELVGVAQQAAASGQDALVAVVERSMAAVADDPELLRFVVAEYGGAFASFRAALRSQLSALTAALHVASPGAVPTFAAEAAVVLLLDGVGRALEADPTARGVIKEQLVHTMRKLLTNPAGVRA
jgi:AcrR family transcriptional regulator